MLLSTSSFKTAVELSEASATLNGLLKELALEGLAIFTSGWFQQMPVMLTEGDVLVRISFMGDPRRCIQVRMPFRSIDGKWSLHTDRPANVEFPSGFGVPYFRTLGWRLTPVQGKLILDSLFPES